MSTTATPEPPHHKPPHHKPPHQIELVVDGENFETAAHELTARQILELAGIDPATHYLVRIQGRHQIPYKDDPDTEIRLHEGIEFISVSTGPTPVS
jgi:hypothetical protein